MGRSLLLLAVLTAALVLVRPRGPRQADGLQGWSWLAMGLALQVLAIGAGLNLLVMAVNGGLMPIAPAALHALGGPHKLAGAAVGLSKDRLLGDGEARLAFLDDRVGGGGGGAP